MKWIIKTTIKVIIENVFFPIYWMCLCFYEFIWGDDLEDVWG